MKKKIFGTLKKLWPLSFPLCVMSFFLLDLSFRYFYRFSGSTPVRSSRPMLFSLGWSLLLSGLTALLPRLARRIAMVVLHTLFSVLTLVHAAMYRIFGNFFTFSDMNFAGDGAKFFSWSYLSFRKGFLLFLVISILMMALAAFLVPERFPEKKHRLLREGGALGVVLVSLIPLLSMHFALQPKGDSMWWGNTYDPTDETVVYSEFTNTNRSMMLTGIYQYTFRNFGKAFGIGENSRDKQRLTEYYEEREISGENEMTGILEGKNLIMVMLESMDTWMLTEEYMPNLYALQEESVDFVHHYTPLYLSAGTFNTEILSLTGQIPAVAGLPSSAYSTNSFPLSLPSLFREKGYSANSFHSSNPSIYSRGSIHTNLGFESYHSYKEIEMEDPMLDSQLMSGYDQMVSDGPFYSYIITYSGHGPYTSEFDNIALPHMEAAKAAVEKSGVTGSGGNMEEYTRAIAHAMETDAFVGKLVERLQKEDRLRDTVLLFYTDHYGKYMTDKSFLSQLKGVEEGSPELYRTPFFLYAQGVAPQKVEKYTSTMDMMPTLMNLFGLSGDCRYYAGDDIFGDRGGYVIFPNYGWYDGETYYSGNGQETLTPEMQERTKEVQERMNASWDLLKCDYFKDYEN